MDNMDAIIAMLLIILAILFSLIKDYGLVIICCTLVIICRLNDIGKVIKRYR